MEPDKLIWGYIQAKKQLEWMKTQKGAWMKIQVYRQIIRGYEAKLKELTNAVNQRYIRQDTPEEHQERNRS